MNYKLQRMPKPYKLYNRDKTSDMDFCKSQSQIIELQICNTQIIVFIFFFSKVFSMSSNLI